MCCAGLAAAATSSGNDDGNNDNYTDLDAGSEAILQQSQDTDSEDSDAGFNDDGVDTGFSANNFG